ncbi:MAG: ABC transporter permease [Pseudomonadota bacterium]|jgi:simple sugar transport system permease protein|nr:ABC transporter permease [Pseudomonadota bacterium]MEC8795155.1 ABC transporter permease [Pseudomonadota bacterium]
MRLEPISAPTPARRILPPVLALVATLVVTSVLVMIAGRAPGDVLRQIVIGAVGSKFALLETLNRTTPLIFTGLAVAVAFRAKLWNIGAEAQLYAGAVITVILGTGAMSAPSFVMLPVLAVAAFVAGALILLGPVILKTRLGVDEVVTTLLFNFIFLLLVSFLLEGPLKDPMGMGWPKSARMLPEGRLPRIFDGVRLHWGFGVALIAALVIWVMDAKSTLGFEMRAVGQNRDAARFAGIPVTSVMIKTAVISGGLAALAGFSEVSGLKGSLTLDLSPGFGYTGIVVAMLALLHPLGVVVAAFFVAAIFVGADSMSRAIGVPSYIADIMLASALLFMVLAILLTKFRVRRD